MYFIKNKAKVYTILAFISLFLLSSCGSILGVFYGIKEPKIESEESLMAYLEKKKLSTENIFCVDTSDFRSVQKLMRGTVNVLIFDKNGTYIPYGDANACNAHAAGFIETLNDTTDYDTSTLIHRDSLLNKFRHLNGTKLSSNTIQQISSGDFLVIASWAKYAGKLNKTKVRDWEKQAKNNKNVNIAFVKLNLDLQQWWGIESKNKDIKLTKKINK